MHWRAANVKIDALTFSGVEYYSLLTFVAFYDTLANMYLVLQYTRYHSVCVCAHI